MSDPVIIGDATLHLGDCLEILPTLDKGKIDVVVTDPPYGIGYVHSGGGSTGKTRFGGVVRVMHKRRFADAAWSSLHDRTIQSKSGKPMFDAIIGWLVVAGCGALAILGVRWKVRADRAKQQIDDYQLSSDRWKADAEERIAEIRRRAAGEAPIDPKSRKDFE